MNFLYPFQGEASPNSRRAVSASHLLHVKGLLKGASIEISATNEDDIDEEKIQEKLKKIICTIGFTKAVKGDKTPSPLEEKAKPFVASPIRSPIKIPTPVPLSPPPEKTLEKPKSPQKLVSPFLNPQPTVAPEPQKTHNGNGHSNGATESGPSHVNKIRAMFSQQKSEDASSTNGDSLTKKQPPAKPIRNSIARKMEEQKAIFENSMLDAPVKNSTKREEIMREIQAAKQQAAEQKQEQEEAKPAPVIQNQTYQKQEEEQKLEEERCIRELEQQEFAPVEETAKQEEVPNENGKLE